MASFVDVPGHERFVRHMLAGAHGIDAVVLVVAADESVMPQTREHFQICRLLGVPRGLVALTKCDAADAESQATAALETAELVAGSFLAGAPVVRVSARTGEGLPELRAALLSLAQASPARPASGPAAPADRSRLLDEGLRRRRDGDAGGGHARRRRRGRGAALGAPRARARAPGPRRARRSAPSRRHADRGQPGRSRNRGARPRRRAGPAREPPRHVDARRRAQPAAGREAAQGRRPPARARGERRGAGAGAPARARPAPARAQRPRTAAARGEARWRDATIAW